MTRSISFRRHQRRRILSKRMNNSHAPLDKSLIGKCDKTAKFCSCWMCGNPRKHFNSETLQEKRADEVEKSSWLDQKENIE